MTDSDRLLSPAELADYLGVPVGTLYQWTYRKVGPRFYKVGRHCRYRMSDVQEWLTTRAIEGLHA